MIIKVLLTKRMVNSKIFNWLFLSLGILYSACDDHGDPLRNDLIAGTWEINKVYLNNGDTLTMVDYTIKFFEEGNGQLEFINDTIPFRSEFYIPFDKLNIYIDFTKYDYNKLNNSIIGYINVYNVNFVKNKLTLTTTTPLPISPTKNELINYHLVKK